MDLIGKFCVIRTESAEVHAGVILAISQDGKVVDLENSVRIWRWKGAFTLSEVSQKGVAESSRISTSVPFIQLCGVIEKIPCSKKARKNLKRSRNG
jgi:hypothetical protein